MVYESNLWKVLFEMQEHNKLLKYVPLRSTGRAKSARRLEKAKKGTALKRH